MDSIKRILLSILILIIAAMLFTGPTENNQNSTSIDEVIDIVDKDNIVHEEEVTITPNEEEQKGKNIFVIIIEGISSIVLGIVGFILDLINKLVFSL